MSNSETLPTINTLLEVQNRPISTPRGTPPPLLLVTQSVTPGEANLSGVFYEGAVIRQLVPQVSVLEALTTWARAKSVARTVWLEATACLACTVPTSDILSLDNTDPSPCHDTTANAVTPNTDYQTRIAFEFAYQQCYSAC